VRGASGTSVADATSGFRAISRRAAYRMFVHNRFTYTLETIVQGGRLGLAFENVVIETNPKTRASRLFRSLPQYLRRNGPVILRAYAMYRPVQTFAYVAILLFAAGAGLVVRFFYYFLRDPTRSGHQQSLIVGVGCVILAFVVGIVAMLSDLLSANRRLLEEVLARLRRIDSEKAVESMRRGDLLEGIRSTGAPPWRKALKP
jgi:hypothetical protein